MVLPHYKDPPIAEVVCGFFFEPLTELDPLAIGWYAREVHDEFPIRSIMPALSEAGLIMGATPPIRAWLTSSDEAFLLQVQQDRFYLNWRARGTSYPRFNDHDGRPGILARALDEFGRFGSFCQREFGAEVRLVRTELAKVDHLVRDIHWRSVEELYSIVPALGPIGHLAASEAIAVRFARSHDGGELAVSMAMDDEMRIFAIESRCRGSIDATEDVRNAMIRRNEVLNRFFEGAIPDEVRDEKFRREPQ